MKFANSGDWDTLDPADTYYAYSWNFARLYGRSLMMFKSAPGQERNELVPDLAESPGESEPDARPGPTRSGRASSSRTARESPRADVKYAVVRSTDKTTFPNGPTYFKDFLDLPADYKGPYKTPDVNTDSAIETPDNYTIVFKPRRRSPGSTTSPSYPTTMPVPKAKDTGAKYRNTIVSTGPYKFEDLRPGQELQPGPQLISGTRPPTRQPQGAAGPHRGRAQRQRRRHRQPDHQRRPRRRRDGPESSLAHRAGPAGSGPQGERGQPALARLWYTSINPTVPPLNNIECRKAILYAMDRTGYQTAYGGQFAGGDLATTILPPIIPGIRPSICTRTVKITRVISRRPRSP